MKRTGKPKVQLGEGRVALYHYIKRDEGFQQSAQILFKLVKEAQELYPGKPRLLYLDIEGHRNSQGGFDADMFELQKEFMLGFLLRFVTEVHGPLAGVVNPNQDNDIPEGLVIHDAEDGKRSVE